MVLIDTADVKTRRDRLIPEEPEPFARSALRLLNAKPLRKEAAMDKNKKFPNALGYVPDVRKNIEEEITRIEKLISDDQDAINQLKKKIADAEEHLLLLRESIVETPADYIGRLREMDPNQGRIDYGSTAIEYIRSWTDEKCNMYKGDIAQLEKLVENDNRNFDRQQMMQIIPHNQKRQSHGLPAITTTYQLITQEIKDLWYEHLHGMDTGEERARFLEKELRGLSWSQEDKAKLCFVSKRTYQNWKKKTMR